MSSYPPRTSAAGRSVIRMRDAYLLLLALPTLNARVMVTHRADPSGVRLAGLTASASKGVAAIKSTLSGTFDARGGRDRTYEARLSGQLPNGNVSWLGLNYEVAHRVGARQTAYKLVVRAADKLTVIASTPFINKGPPSLVCGPPALVEASASTSLGDGAWDVDASWHFKARTARLAVQREVGRKALAEVEMSYEVDEDATEGELAYVALLAPRRTLRATGTAAVGPGGHASRLAAEYTDGNFERGATWVATVSVSSQDTTPKVAVARRCAF